MLEVKPGATSKLVDVFIQNSTLTTGAGLTGLVYNTSGLTAYYKRQGQSSWTAITLATMTQGTWATGGFVEGDATNAPGYYEFGIPDACLAAGADWVDFMFKGAANMCATPFRVLIKQTFDVNVSTWRGSTPAALSTNGLLQTMLMRWLTDDTGGTPSALASGGVPVSSNVKKAVALSKFSFLMVASSDHLTPLTGLTVACQISKDGGAFTNSTNSPAEIGNGMYYVNLTASEMNANNIVLYFTSATADGQFVTLITNP